MKLNPRWFVAVAAVIATACSSGSTTAESTTSSSTSSAAPAATSTVATTETSTSAVEAVSSATTTTADAAPVVQTPSGSVIGSGDPSDHDAIVYPDYPAQAGSAILTDTASATASIQVWFELLQYTMNWQKTPDSGDAKSTWEQYVVSTLVDKPTYDAYYSQQTTGALEGVDIAKAKSLVQRLLMLVETGQAGANDPASNPSHFKILPTPASDTAISVATMPDGTQATKAEFAVTINCDQATSGGGSQSCSPYYQSRLYQPSGGSLYFVNEGQSFKAHADPAGGGAVATTTSSSATGFTDTEAADPNAPSSHFIAIEDKDVLGNFKIVWLDSSSGAVLYQTPLQTIPPNLVQSSTTPKFAPSFDLGGGSSQISTCCPYSFNPSLTKVAGVWTVPVGGTVPATWSFGDGTVSSPVKVSTEGGFGQSTTANTIAAAFGPDGTLWSTQTSSSDSSTITLGVAGTSGAPITNNDGTRIYFNAQTGKAQGDETSGSADQYIDQSTLPASNLQIGVIRKDDTDGKMAAFAALDSGNGLGAFQIYTMSSSGGTPTKLTDYTVNDPNGYHGVYVIRYVP